MFNNYFKVGKHLRYNFQISSCEKLFNTKVAICAIAFAPKELIIVRGCCEMRLSITFHTSSMGFHSGVLVGK